MPSNFGMNTSNIAFLAVILGGMTLYSGPIVGTIVYVALYYLASLYMSDRWPLLLGGIFILSIMLMRQGIGIFLLKGWRRVIEPSRWGVGARTTEGGPDNGAS